MFVHSPCIKNVNHCNFQKCANEARVSLSLINTKIREFPISIGKLKSLSVLVFSCKMIPMSTGKIWKLPSATGMLENLEGIHAERCK